MNRDFNKWFKTMTPLISNYRYYVDFKSVYKNVEKFQNEVNIMNSLVGSDDIESDFIRLLDEHPEILKCIPALLAVRNETIYTRDDDGVHNYNFKEKEYSADQYATFMRRTGLFDLIQRHGITSLLDYLLGVNTGLDSNARKNRGGSLMEAKVEGFIKKTRVPYCSQVWLRNIETKWGIDLSIIPSNTVKGKKWDFVVEAGNTVFLIETNFYASKGSKLNETARSYKAIAEEVARIDGMEFIWITDGKGWEGAKTDLESTFAAMQHLYNIQDMERGVLRRVFSDAKKAALL